MYTYAALESRMLWSIIYYDVVDEFFLVLFKKSLSEFLTFNCWCV